MTPIKPKRQPRPTLAANQNDLTNVKFGSLTVVAYEGKTKRKNSLWTCICDCGGFRRGVAYQSLMQGLTRKCLQCGIPPEWGRHGARSKKNHNNQRTAGRTKDNPQAPKPTPATTQEDWC
jgi:hypothetical protein